MKQHSTPHKLGQFCARYCLGFTALFSFYYVLAVALHPSNVPLPLAYAMGFALFFGGPFALVAAMAAFIWACFELLDRPLLAMVSIAAAGGAIFWFVWAMTLDERATTHSSAVSVLQAQQHRPDGTTRQQNPVVMLSRHSGAGRNEDSTATS